MTLNDAVRATSGLHLLYIVLTVGLAFTVTNQRSTLRSIYKKRNTQARSPPRASALLFSQAAFLWKLRRDRRELAVVRGLREAWRRMIRPHSYSVVGTYTSISQRRRSAAAATYSYSSTYSTLRILVTDAHVPLYASLSQWEGLDDEDFAITDDAMEMVSLENVGGGPKQLQRGVEERTARSEHSVSVGAGVGVGVGEGASVGRGGEGVRPPSPTGEEETKGHSSTAVRPPSPPPSPNEISV